MLHEEDEHRSIHPQWFIEPMPTIGESRDHQLLNSIKHAIFLRKIEEI
ncbi:hypothetical protein LINPERPRIM_LOCUS22379 [Linum perenne]